MRPEDMMLSEISHSQKDKSCRLHSGEVPRPIQSTDITQRGGRGSERVLLGTEFPLGGRKSSGDGSAHSSVSGGIKATELHT